MSFLTNLAKGFVRSAVNQVGRDTGKIISNQIYVDAHSTPFRSIRNDKGIFYDKSNNIVPETEFTHMLYENGYKYKYFTTGFISKLFIWVMGALLSIFIWYTWGKYFAVIPSVILFILAVIIILFESKQMNVVTKKEMPVFQTDQRYKDNRRMTGYTIGEATQTMDATPQYTKKRRIIGAAYLILSIYMYLSTMYVYSINDPFTWSIFGKICIIPFATITLLHIVFRR